MDQRQVVSEMGMRRQTGSLGISYTPTAPVGSGQIIAASGRGNTGALFLQNQSGIPVEVVHFTLRTGNIPIYFGVTITPEPSTYIILLGAYLFIVILSVHKSRKNV